MRPSGIRAIFEKAATQEGLIDLSIGQPDIPVPLQVKEAIIDAVRLDRTGYTSSAGLPELRKKVLSGYSGFPCAEDAIITPGVTAGIFLSLSALCEEGDEVIIPEPYFVVYPEIARFLGIVPVFAKGGFKIDTDAIRSCVSGKTKAIILNSPCNPTGHVASREEVEEIVSIAKEHSLTIISDEVYRIFDYEDKFFSPAEIYPDTLILDGFSKSLSMTGLRAGYVVGKKDLLSDMNRLMQYTFVCAPSIIQHALLADTSPHDGRQETYKRRRDLVAHAFKDVPGFVPPKGAFYACIPVASGKEMADRCLEKGLLVVPGSAFSSEDSFIRISFAVEEKKLKEGLRVIRSLMDH